MSAASRSRLFGAKVLAARTIGELSRRSGRGGGTTLPGRVLLRADDLLDWLDQKRAPSPEE